MHTHFYNRTLLYILDEPVPQCFLELDDYYDKKCTCLNDALNSYFLTYSENMAIRYANVLLYSSNILSELYSANNPFISAQLISSYLVGYYASVKSFLDAIAIGLNELLNLQLNPLEKDLCRKAIWPKLDAIADVQKYENFKSFYEIVNQWRNAATHNLAPVATVCGPTSARMNKSPLEIDKSDVEIKFVNIPGFNNHELSSGLAKVEWVSPAKHIEEWHENITELACFFCKDIMHFTDK